MKATKVLAITAITMAASAAIVAGYMGLGQIPTQSRAEKALAQATNLNEVENCVDRLATTMKGQKAPLLRPNPEQVKAQALIMACAKPKSHAAKTDHRKNEERSTRIAEQLIQAERQRRAG